MMRPYLINYDRKDMPLGAKMMLKWLSEIKVYSNVRHETISREELAEYLLKQAVKYYLTNPCANKNVESVLASAGIFIRDNRKVVETVVSEICKKDTICLDCGPTTIRERAISKYEKNLAEYSDVDKSPVTFFDEMGNLNIMYSRTYTNMVDELAAFRDYLFLDSIDKLVEMLMPDSIPASDVVSVISVWNITKDQSWYNTRYNLIIENVEYAVCEEVHKKFISGDFNGKYPEEIKSIITDIENEQIKREIDNHTVDNDRSTIAIIDSMVLFDFEIHVEFNRYIHGMAFETDRIRM